MTNILDDGLLLATACFIALTAINGLLRVLSPNHDRDLKPELLLLLGASAAIAAIYELSILVFIDKPDVILDLRAALVVAIVVMGIEVWEQVDTIILAKLRKPPTQPQ